MRIDTPWSPVYDLQIEVYINTKLFYPNAWNDFIPDLKDTIRHEIEHVTQFFIKSKPHPLKGRNFNRLLRGAVKPGIYSGGELNYVGNTVTIQPFKAYINVRDNITPAIDNMLMHVETEAIINLPVTEVNGDILIIYYEWQDVIDNWLDITNRTGTPTTNKTVNEIVMGTIEWTGGNISAISEDGRTKGFFDEDYNIYMENDLFVEGNALFESDML